MKASYTAKWISIRHKYALYLIVSSIIHKINKSKHSHK